MRALLRPLHGLVAALVVIAALAGCATRSAEWVPDGKPRALAEVRRWGATADISRVSGIDPKDAPEARVQVLVWLREQGRDGDRAATLLTEGFPSDVAAVPVYVEIAVIDGTRSLIVVEAIAGRSGKLDTRRLWVFAMDSGKLVTSSSYLSGP